MSLSAKERSTLEATVAALKQGLAHIDAHENDHKLQAPGAGQPRQHIVNSM